MTFDRTTDYRMIRSILTLPRLYPWMCDDSAPSRQEFQVNTHPGIWYVLVRNSGLIVGLFCFIPENGICWAGHVAMLPKVPPSVTHRVAREMVPWLWTNTGCRRLIASIPRYNWAAIRIARIMGLEQYGVNEKSFLKHGKLHDQILMGLSRPD